MDGCLNEVSLRQLVDALAHELGRIGLQGKKLEDAVGEDISTGVINRETISISLQGLDRVVQSVTDIANYLDHLAENISPDIQIDPTHALSKVRQQNLVPYLRRRILDEFDSGLPRGQVDFFE